ncbi:hypothetical protein CDL12_06300 [Handroanthus impetiginosus]|uniref:Uncharacterized protein n=1 Tax=Handroanthus impetiginosus TaxID=429701 RepID=A0A2G9HUK8_9LAMI|nr:hypothetical protein CDL12_06300 [Handroanthus impetiginosus]
MTYYLFSTRQMEDEEDLIHFISHFGEIMFQAYSKIKILSNQAGITRELPQKLCYRSHSKCRWYIKCMPCFSIPIYQHTHGLMISIKVVQNWITWCKISSIGTHCLRNKSISVTHLIWLIFPTFLTELS